MKKLPNAVKWLIIVAVLAAMAAMTFAVNDSPFAGKEGKFVTSRQIRDRLPVVQHVIFSCDRLYCPVAQLPDDRLPKQERHDFVRKRNAQLNRPVERAGNVVSVRL